MTLQQNRTLHLMISHNILSEKRLYELVEELIGIPSISALSKQEASFIIKRIGGSRRWLYPGSRQITQKTSMNLSNLPNLSYVRGIRLIARELGWDKDHLKNWLMKYLKTKNIRSLDAESARKAFIGLRKIQMNRKAKL